MNKNIESCFIFLCASAAGACLLALFFVLAVIFVNGCVAISPDFLVTPAKSFGKEGGILYQILGSLLLVTVAALLCLPVALGTALFKNEFLKGRLLQKGWDILIYGLNGIPSIMFGLFGLIVFVNYFQTGISWLVGSVVLAVMILPTVVLATSRAMNALPDKYRESALALGFEKWQVITDVVLPKACSGAVTGLFLGLARAAGETAPIMFIATAFSGAEFPHTFFEPVSALPTHILALTQQATDQKALENAWGASLTLFSLVVVFSLCAFVSRRKMERMYRQ